MCNKPKPQRIIMTRNETSVIGSVDWFLRSSTTGKSNVPEKYSEPVSATFKPLINGEQAFGVLYEKLLAAEKSIDIAIWGFQPSMFFKRSEDGNNLKSIGGLLIEKALQKVKVRVLVWSMLGHIQNFSEANQGNIVVSGVLRKNKIDGVTDAQVEYDRYWYEAITGELNQRIQHPHEKLKVQARSDFFGGDLIEFINSDKKEYIQYKTRSVSRFQKFFDIDAPILTNTILGVSLSHHQKSVLIDYCDPNNAVGFVLEHNMVDNYWDDSHHFMDSDLIPSHFSSDEEYQQTVKYRSQPKHSRNYPVPYQDVSSIVTGQVLWDLNRNFEQSWQREEYFGLGELKHYKNVITGEQPEDVSQREKYLPNPNVEEYGKKVKAQILRTYDIPDVEDIKEMYLQNITQATSYIYTENQYFRYPPLVEAFKKNWQKMRKNRPDTMPIYWFVVTNSTDEAVKDGSYNTDRMFELLGRRDVMPNVQNSWKITFGLDKELTQSEAQNSGLNQNDNPDFTSEVGIKTHICTLSPQNIHKKGTYINDDKHEVYIHSKVTIIDDVFCFIGSANLNYRSMVGDTELGIITECKETNQRLRQDLWQIHTGKSAGEPENPFDLSDLISSKRTFEKWDKILEDDVELLETTRSIRKFFRQSYYSSSID